MDQYKLERLDKRSSIKDFCENHGLNFTSCTIFAQLNVHEAKAEPAFEQVMRQLSFLKNFSVVVIVSLHIDYDR